MAKTSRKNSPPRASKKSHTGSLPQPKDKAYQTIQVASGPTTFGGITAPGGIYITPYQSPGTGQGILPAGTTRIVVNPDINSNGSGISPYILEDRTGTGIQVDYDSTWTAEEMVYGPGSSAGNFSINKSVAVTHKFGPFGVGDFVVKKLDPMEFLEIYMKLSAKSNPNLAGSGSGWLGGFGAGSGGINTTGTVTITVPPGFVPPSVSLSIGGTIPQVSTGLISYPQTVQVQPKPLVQIEEEKEKEEEDAEQSSRLFGELLLCTSKPYRKLRHQNHQLSLGFFKKDQEVSEPGERDYDLANPPALGCPEMLFQEFWNVDKNTKVEIALENYEAHFLETYEPEGIHTKWQPVSAIKAQIAKDAEALLKADK